MENDKPLNEYKKQPETDQEIARLKELVELAKKLAVSVKNTKVAKGQDAPR